MKRDMDLVRTILQICEAVPEGQLLPQTPAVPGHSEVEIGYHIHLMGQAGLLRVAEATFSESTAPQAVILSVTWKGHEFVEAARSSVVWEASKKVLNKAGAAGIDVTFQVLKAVAKQKLKELGIDLGE